MTGAERRLALAIVAACAKAGQLPGDDILHWLVQGIGLAVEKRISLEQGLGLRMPGSRGGSTGATARLLRDGNISAVGELLAGSRSEKARNIARRMERLAAGGRPKSEADGRLIDALKADGRPLAPRTIRRILA